MAEYALVTMVVAAWPSPSRPSRSPRLGLATRDGGACSDPGRADRADKRRPCDRRRATLARAPYPRAALRYHCTVGWIGGRVAAVECVLAKATPDATGRRLATELGRDPALGRRLRRMRVTVARAAGALARGTGAAC